MKNFLPKIVLPIVALAMLAFGVFHILKAQQQLPKPPPPAQPARSPFGQTIAGSGVVESRSENIAIGSALPGVVLEVYVPVDEVGKQVQAGDPLFRVDDRQLKAQLTFQQANLAAAEAKLAKLEEMPRPEEIRPPKPASKPPKPPSGGRRTRPSGRPSCWPATPLEPRNKTPSSGPTRNPSNSGNRPMPS
jgi:multidrug efflux pump subunit AcrA (membrane-fusion protein)